MDRNDTIKRIRTALRRRSGINWSVTGGRGTSWGWIRIEAPPSRQSEYGYTGDTDRATLATLLGLETVHQQGVSIPSSNDYYREYIDRAEGRTPEVCGKPYWD